MQYRIFYFWDAQNPGKNKIVLRQDRKVVGPKAPGAHRAHGPRPLGPIGPIRSHAVAWGPWAHILFNIYLSYSFICLFCLFI